jgi:3-methyladenine DNA glycosylase AlkD
LWRIGIHDARILASLVDTPDAVTLRQLEEWVGDVNSWDVSDQGIMNLFARTTGAASTAVEWSVRAEEFVQRAGFIIMARLASTYQTADDSVFELFLVATE